MPALGARRNGRKKKSKTMTPKKTMAVVVMAVVVVVMAVAVVIVVVVAAPVIRPPKAPTKEGAADLHSCNNDQHAARRRAPNMSCNKPRARVRTYGTLPASGTHQ